jgi:hypothetical protein
MSRLSLIAVLLAASDAVAAPAPFAKPEGAVEAVFDAQTERRTRLVLAYLRSEWFLTAMSLDSQVEKLFARQDHVECRDWLRIRLSVTSNGTLIRVRLSDGANALAVLDAITDVLTGKGRNEESNLETLVRKVRSRRIHELLFEKQTGSLDDGQALAGQEVIEKDPLKLHVAPRAVSRWR